MKRVLVSVLCLGLAACAWVSPEPGAEAVTQRDVDSVGECKRLGKTHTQTLDGVGFIPRMPSQIEEDLLALARNEAVRMGGNVVSPLSGIVDGEQDFAIYRCP